MPDAWPSCWSRDEFWEADLHIFETGMYYDLYNAIYSRAARPARSSRSSTTPPRRSWSTTPWPGTACERSIAQRYNLTLARHVACVSEFNLEVARSVGVPESGSAVLHLPAADRARGTAGAAAPDREARSGCSTSGASCGPRASADMLELIAAPDRAGRLDVSGDPRRRSPVLRPGAGSRRRGRPRADSGGRLEVVLAPDDAT